MFREKIKKNIIELVSNYLQQAKEDLGIEFEVKENIFYGSVIDGDNPKDINIFLYIEPSMRKSEGNRYQNYGFEEHKTDDYDGEVNICQDLQKYLNGNLVNPFPYQYENVKLDFKIEMQGFKNYQFDIESFAKQQYQEFDQFIYENENLVVQRQYQELRNSDTPNPYNNTEARENFIALANGQRGKPEVYMVKLQHFMGGGVMNYMIEHIGDLTHRMSQRIYMESGTVQDSVKDIYPKLERGLRSLKSGYGFEKEFEENLVNNYEYLTSRSEIKDFESFDDFRNEVIDRLDKYAKLHSELKVYNKAQYYAREAAVNIGKIDIKKATDYIQKLKDMIDNNTFFYEASLYDPEFELKFNPNKEILYHGAEKEFETFDPLRVGDKITSLGLGHYLTPDRDLASDYGDFVMTFEVDTSSMLDWNNLTIPQRAKIEKLLLESVPEERIAGFGETIEKIVPANSEGYKEFIKLKHKTRNYYHDAAKAKTEYNEDDTITISYRKAGSLKAANSQQLMTLMNEYRPELAKELGFKAAKFSNQVALYDSSLAQRYFQSNNILLEKINKNENKKTSSLKNS